MLELQKTLKFLDHFSIITVADDKIPNFTWRKFQNEKISIKQFSEQYEYKGGRKWTDKDGIEREIKATKNFGIVTGFEDLECLDIDLKDLGDEPEDFIMAEFLYKNRDKL